MKKKLMGALILILLLGGCTSRAEKAVSSSPMPALPTSTPTPEAESTLVPTPLPDPTEESLTVTYLSQQHSGRVYTAEEASDTPEENDLRIDVIAYLGEEVIYETIGVAYEVATSRYQDGAWVAEKPRCLILERSGYDNVWQKVFGEADLENRTWPEAVFETVWGLMDVEVSLCIDGYPNRIGPGSEAKFYFLREEPTMTIQTGWEPLYAEGDEWRSYTYPNFEASCYYNAAEGREVVTHIETGRSDMMTYRGIRVGDSRKKVMDAYPEGLNSVYWNYEGDYLCYCRDKDIGFGPAILFWFEDDAVVKQELVNMLD